MLEDEHKQLVFEQMVKKIALKRTTGSDYSKVQKGLETIVKYHSKSTDSQLDLGYLLVVNNSTSVLDESYTFKDLKNVKFILGSPEGAFKLAPGSEILLVFKRVENKPWSWG